MDTRQTFEHVPNPIEKASFASKVFFLYTLQYFKKAFRQQLKVGDLYETIPCLKAATLGDRIQEKWTKCTNDSIYKLLWKLFRKRYLFLCVLDILSISLKFIQSFAVGSLIASLKPGSSSKLHQCSVAFLLIFFIMCEYTYRQHFLLMKTKLGLQVRTSLSSFLYRQCLLRARFERNELGHVITLLTKDVEIFALRLEFCIELVTNIIKCFLLWILLYVRTGAKSLPFLGMFGLIVCIQCLNCYMISTLKKRTLKKTDARLQLISDVLAAIRTAKMLVLENFFIKKISKIRRKEAGLIGKIFFLWITLYACTEGIYQLGLYLVIFSYLSTKDQVQFDIVYFTITCFQHLHLLSLLQGSHACLYTSQYFSALDRLNSLFNNMPEKTCEIAVKNQEKPAKIICEHLQITRKDRVILKDCSVTFESPGLYIITGRSGSGKSTLLKAILQEMPSTNGKIDTSGTFSYASQEPWLFPSSIKQNIIFHEDFDNDLYLRVIKVCALVQDLKHFENGDETVISEQGINLSKGQQARINLARAIYRKSDIYILDDCLTSIDPVLSDFIFKECILKFLRDKIVIFVTKETKYFRNNAQVFRLDKDELKLLENLTNSSQITSYPVDNDESETEKTTDEQNIEDLDEDSPLIKNINVYTETQKKGGIKCSHYRKCIKLGGGYFVFSLVILTMIMTQATSIYLQKLISNWVNFEAKSRTISQNHTRNDSESFLQETNNISLSYKITFCCFLLSITIRGLASFYFCQMISVRLHKLMLNSVMKAPVEFFDKFFLGTILNRFSEDMTGLDEILPMYIYEAATQCIFVIINTFVLCMVKPVLTIFIMVWFAGLLLLSSAFSRLGRNLKRIDAATRSPMIGHLVSTLKGLTTIRAAQAENILTTEFDRHQDLYISGFFTYECCNKGFSLVAEYLCFTFFALVVVKYLIWNEDEVGTTGFLITNIFQLAARSQRCLRKAVDFENNMVGVERIIDFSEIDSESEIGTRPENFPKAGSILFKNVSLNYNKSKTVLSNLNFHIDSGDKIGIVGRTGAGKSSIMSLVFRLYEYKGDILIDNVDIKTLALHFLRSKISVIPQNLILFAGTFRENFDPFETRSDEDIWNVVKSLQLDKIIPSIDDKVESCNLSKGQKQLCSFARLLLGNKNRILMLDEASGDLDVDTSKLIMDNLYNSFSGCTIIIIAHKLASVLSCDKIMILEKGNVTEFLTRKELLKSEAFGKIFGLDVCK